MKFGLPQKNYDAINRVFAKYPEIDEVLIYGSRAKGTHKPGSDIDLTLIGKALTLSDLLKIENELDDLMLPYFIDLSLFYSITDPGFLQHIKRVGLPFYTKEHLAAQLDS